MRVAACYRFIGYSNNSKEGFMKIHQPAELIEDANVALQMLKAAQSNCFNRKTELQ